MLEEFPTDTVTLVKPSGDKIENIKALVQPRMIFLPDATVPVEEGDRLVRVLPNGLEERFVVEDRGYYGGMGEIEPHYQVKVSREGAGQKGRPVVNWNLSGPNVRVNIGSEDSSVNIVTLSTAEVFGELREIVSKDVPEQDREALLAKIAEMVKSQGTPSFLECYREFIALAANHLTVLAPVLPALAQMLR
jgi:hypothetical protein